MRSSIPLLAAFGFGAALLAPGHAAIAATPNFVFPLTVATGAANCLPNASGRVTIGSLGEVENMHVEVQGLPPNAGFDVFVIQVPNAPFGLSWYQGDIKTDANGFGVADFTGRFSIETFIVAPNKAVAPVVDSSDASSNPPTPPVHTLHLGIWFDNRNVAGKFGCPTTKTPFNGQHTAGIQVMNSGTFPDTAGPLGHVQP